MPLPLLQQLLKKNGVGGATPAPRRPLELERWITGSS